MKIKMKMYTQNSCPNCKRAKFMLESAPVGIELEEINVDENPNAKAYLDSVLISNSLPTFVIGNKVIRGFNEGELMEVFGV